MDERRPDLVGVRVLPGQGDRLLVEVDARHVAAPALDQRVEAEPAGVAADVEHRAVLAEPGELQAVLALVAEEAGLVAPLEVDAEPDPVLLDRHPRRERRGWRAGGPGSLRPGRSARRRGPGSASCPTASAEDRQDRADPLIHPQAEDLDGEDVVEPVDDQAREAVPLGVDDPVGVGRRVEPERLAPQGDRAGRAASARSPGPGGITPGASSRSVICDRLFQSPKPSGKCVAVDDPDEVAVHRPDGPGRADHHLPVDERVVPRRADGDGRQLARRVERPVGDGTRAGCSVDRLRPAGHPSRSIGAWGDRMSIRRRRSCDEAGKVNQGTRIGPIGSEAGSSSEATQSAMIGLVVGTAASPIVGLNPPAVLVVT